MIHTFKLNLILIILSAVLASCNNGPKSNKSEAEYQPIENGTELNYQLPSGHPIQGSKTSTEEELHMVVVKEILSASRYLYLKVSENENQFWIAIRKKDVEVGKKYYYKRALLKTNYESKENNKVFEKIYLVSNLVEADHGSHTNPLEKAGTPPNIPQPAPVQSNDQKPDAKDQVAGNAPLLKIADLVEDYKNYAGRKVRISGRCVKVNANIMDRNWIHIQDGTKDDFDLVVTTDTFIPEGSEFTIQARVSINKDFGAGYVYELILEDGKLIE